MNPEILRDHRAAWERKPVLRAVYRDYYDRILKRSVPGRMLEIGGGAGTLKDSIPAVVSLDLLPSSRLDVQGDAKRLPFVDGCFATVVMVDVLHHLPDPVAFLTEAIRVLGPGGRIVMVEPAITLASYPVLRFLHPEPVDLRDDPFEPAFGRSTDIDPFDSNQATPTLMFGRRRSDFNRRFPELSIDECSWISLWAYPLSGGFRSWSLLPGRALRILLRIEVRVERLLGRFLAFRLLVVLTTRRTANA